MPHVLLERPLHPAGRAILDARSGVTVEVATDVADFATRAAKADAILLWLSRVDAAFLDRCPKVKVVARYGVGHGHANAVALLPGLRRMLALPNAPDLLAALGMDRDALLSRVSDLIHPALERGLPSAAASVLADDRQREHLREVIVADPCMRTSAVTAEHLDMEAWFGEIRDHAPAQC